MRIIQTVMRLCVGFLSVIICLNGTENLESSKSTVRNHLVECSKVQQHSNVHILDGYVSQHIVDLKNLGIGFGFGKADLNKEDIEKILYDFLDQNPTFYEAYEADKITTNQLKEYIKTALHTANLDKNVLELYSLTTSGLLLFKEKGDYLCYMQQLLDAFVENYRTRGGCFQGVRNRIFVRYSLFLMGYLYELS
ncbi:MAG: hypothetical protein KBD31_00775 [Proteobacteria bacterium]|nr:hypothetical protein [Pseudomonadota bacterium]